MVSTNEMPQIIGKSSASWTLETWDLNHNQQPFNYTLLQQPKFYIFLQCKPKGKNSYGPINILILFPDRSRIQHNSVYDTLKSKNDFLIVHLSCPHATSIPNIRLCLNRNTILNPKLTAIDQESPTILVPCIADRTDMVKWFTLERNKLG